MFRERNLLGAASENTWQIGDFAPTRSLRTKIWGRKGRPPPIIFAWIVRSMNALQLLPLTVFTQRNFVADFLQAKCDCRGKTAVLRFWAPPPFGGLRDNVRCSSWAHRKARLDFLLVLIELFSLGVTVEALRTKIDRKSAISLQRGHFEPKFGVEREIPHQ